MNTRRVRWIFLYALMLAFAMLSLVRAAGPIFTHQKIDQLDKTGRSEENDSAATEREFSEIYSRMADRSTTPKLYIGAGAPTFAPLKIGDIFISTTTAKIYASTGTATSSSWVVLN